MRIDRRFEGPPGHANGGYVAGLLAGTGPARVTIRRPVPLERELEFDGEALRDGDAVLAEVEPLADGIASYLPEVAWDEAREAAARSALSEHHPFPRCFGCGPEHPSGLHCLPGEVGDRSGIWALVWTPDEGAPPFVWAALDCPSGAPIASRTGVPPYVLGRIEGAVSGELRAGEPHLVVAHAAPPVDRRRKRSEVGIFAAPRELVAAAHATWFALERSM